VKWERKNDETKRKTERKQEDREYIHRPDKTRTRDTEETKNHRKRRKKEKKERKVGYRKITGTVEMKRRKGTRGFSVG
jgi:hypothetical protein